MGRLIPAGTGVTRYNADGDRVTDEPEGAPRSSRWSGGRADARGGRVSVPDG